MVAFGARGLAVALAVGRVIPALIDESKGWFVVLGVGFAALAIAFTCTARAASGGGPVDRRWGLPAVGRKVVFFLTA